MRSRCLITITTYRGARHFTLTQFVRRIAAGVVAGLALALLTGGLAIHWLSEKVTSLQVELTELDLERQRVEQSRQQLLTAKRDLDRAVAAQSDDLVQLREELAHIETIIGLEEGHEHAPLPQRVMTATQTAMEKRLMLNTIPNGSPVERRGVTSSFGNRTHPVHGRQAFHGGIDLRAPRGTPVHATADGVVQWAARHADSGMGKMVEVVHNHGFTTVYGHLDSIKVKPGQYVRKGDQLGAAGNTGVATAPHLHYEVRYLQRRLNPAPFMRWSLEDYDLLFEREDRVQWQSLADAVRRLTHPQERPSSLGEPALSVIWPLPANSTSMATSKAGSPRPERFP